MNGIWLVRAGIGLAAAFAANTALSRMETDHDPALVALIALATVAVGAAIVDAFEAASELPWTAPRARSYRETGEDLRTVELRQEVEAHLSPEHDDAVVWELADLAARRLRQVHGLRYVDDPDRAAQLLGPLLADWVSHDRRHRYQPGQRHPRYSVAQLTEVVRRIEAL